MAVALVGAKNFLCRHSEQMSIAFPLDGKCGGMINTYDGKMMKWVSRLAPAGFRRDF